MAVRIRASAKLATAVAAILTSTFVTPATAADDFTNINFEIGAAGLPETHDGMDAAPVQWIDVEAQAARENTQSPGMLGFEKPILTMPDGSVAKLHLGARAGAVRAGITWNLD